VTPSADALLAHVESTRERTNLVLDEGTRAALGQFMTPGIVAKFMASMFRSVGPEIRLLDAGAGVGSLTAAFLHDVAARSPAPACIEATAYEVDPVMLRSLHGVFRSCEEYGQAVGTRFVGHIIERDFIEDATARLANSLFSDIATPSFNAAILNPPYRKISTDSRERGLLRAAGVDVTNLYAAFVGLTARLLEPGGELVAITPRSFCNGPYFRSFRRLLLGEMALLRVHVFESRDRAFSGDSVLQENVIFHARKSAVRSRITLSSSAAPGEPVFQRSVPHEAVVNPSDPNAFIHLAVSAQDAEIADWMSRLCSSLPALGIEVSTGRVVDFRSRELLRNEPDCDTAPLIYPSHFDKGFVAWPRRGGKKPNAIISDQCSASLLVPMGTYVLTKRFTSKEEKRRVVACVLDPERFPTGISDLGIENHVNYFHARGSGLPRHLARGLASFLNSSFVDRFFRQFSGHTQVNAADLRSLRYPSLGELTSMGRRIRATFPEQEEVDRIVEEALS
jgi:adenine-specific DNA-methyltransferase